MSKILQLLGEGGCLILQGGDLVLESIPFSKGLVSGLDGCIAVSKGLVSGVDGCITVSKGLVSGLGGCITVSDRLIPGLYCCVALGDCFTGNGTSVAHKDCGDDVRVGFLQAQCVAEAEWCECRL